MNEDNMILISIHALLAESDPKDQHQACLRYQFLSTLSLRRATVHYDNYNLHCVISIHALLAESDWLRCWQLAARDISIHALLAESDLRVLDGSKSSIISIHALLAESDDTRRFQSFCQSGFLSTLSLRRATVSY